MSRVWGDEDVVELRPLVLVPMSDVPDGKMPRGARSVVKKWLARGLVVRSTYTLALVPGVRRKVDGVFAEITETVETVVVRGAPGSRSEGPRVWASWHNGSFEAAQVLDAGHGVRNIDSKALGEADFGLERWHDQQAARALEMHAAELELAIKRAIAERTTAPLNWWLAAQSPADRPYPCRCDEPVWSPGRNCGQHWCTCWGRSDAALMPFTCCGRRWVPGAR